MRFKIKTKVFLGVFLLASLMTLLVGAILYYFQKNSLEEEFIARHKSIAQVISNNLKQAEDLTDQIMLNTAYALNDKVQGKKISKLRLQELRNQFNVTDLYLIDKGGRYQESTDDFAQKSDFNFYNFCPDYKNLVLKGNAYNQTPILLAYPPNNTKPYKFTQMSTMFKDQIIEVGMHLSFIQDILKTSLTNYSDIMNLSLKTPSGDYLGSIKSKSYDPNENLLKFKTDVPSNDVNCCQCKVKKLTTGNYFYSLEIEVSKKEFISKLNNLFQLILFIELCLIIGCYFLSRKISTSILTRLNNLATTLDNITTTGELTFTEKDNHNDEINLLSNSFNKMIKNLILKEKTIKENEKLKANLQLANQVAHDIRSPLVTFKALKSDLLLLPEESRRRIQMSINRIEEITFNLLQMHKETGTIEKETNSEELLGLLESVITEKRIEFRNNQSIEIEGLFDSQSYGLFSKINRSSLKSIISNLINNSIESLHEKSGIIKILLSTQDDWNLIQVLDNGEGIADEFKTQIFSKGFTTKNTGHGLGLFNAKEEIQSIGGKIECGSSLSSGTTLNIYLPKSDPSNISVDSINLYRYKKIIILDDDPAFHEIWKEKLKKVASKIEYYFSINEIMAIYKELPKETLLLSDYELMDKGMDGIDLIMKYHHASNSILVTARSEEKEIINRCNKLQIKLLPKSLINYVLLQFDCPIIVLIDDDNLIHLNWKGEGKSKGIEVKTFFTSKEFFESKFNDHNALIFIDYNLGTENGLDLAFSLKKKGFRNIKIATGHEHRVSKDFHQTGKEFPLI